MGRVIGLVVLYCVEVIATGVLLYIGFHLGSKIISRKKKNLGKYINSNKK